MTIDFKELTDKIHDLTKQDRIDLESSRSVNLLITLNEINTKEIPLKILNRYVRKICSSNHPSFFKLMLMYSELDLIERIDEKIHLSEDGKMYADYQMMRNDDFHEKYD